MASTLKVDTIAHTGGTTAMTVDSAGRITEPAKPFFHVAGLGSNMNVATGSDTVIPFSSVVHDVGSNWNTSDHRFTAPVNGIYQFCASVRIDTLDQAASYIRLGLRGEQGTGSAIPTISDFFDLLDPAAYDEDTTYKSFQLSRAIYLTAGNRMRATIRQQGGTSNHSHVDPTGQYTQFSGYLIG